MDYYPFRFTANIDKYDFGKYFYSVIYLPEELKTKLPLNKYTRLRVEGEINEYPVEGAFNPDKGEWYFIYLKSF